MPTHRYVAAGLLVLVALAGCSEGTLAPTTTSPGDGTAAGTPPAIGSNEYALGETVELTQEDTTIAVRVVEARVVDHYETTADAGSGNRTVVAPPGEQFVFVKVAVENVGSEHGSTPSAAVRPTNTSADGPPVATWMADGRYLHVRPLPAGEARTGWLLARTNETVATEDVRVAFSTDILITDGEFRWTLTER